jgi:hypothetical protein
VNVYKITWKGTLMRRRTIENEDGTTREEVDHEAGAFSINIGAANGSHAITGARRHENFHIESIEGVELLTSVDLIVQSEAPEEASE